MRSGRHGAARPPVGALVRLDRADFSLFGLQFVLALIVMILAGPTSLVFWFAIVAAAVSVVLAVRRFGRLARDETVDEEAL